jgi:hypothetical protein
MGVPSPTRHVSFTLVLCMCVVLDFDSSSVPLCLKINYSKKQTLVKFRPILSYKHISLLQVTNSWLSEPPLPPHQKEDRKLDREKARHFLLWKSKKMFLYGSSIQLTLLPYYQSGSYRYSVSQP